MAGFAGVNREALYVREGAEGREKLLFDEKVRKLASDVALNNCDSISALTKRVVFIGYLSFAPSPFAVMTRRSFASRCTITICAGVRLLRTSDVSA